MAQSKQQKADSLWTDVDILTQLQIEEYPLKVLADNLGIGESATHERLQRLKNEGTILRSVVVVDRAKVGITHEDVILVKLASPKAESEDALSSLIRPMISVYHAEMIEGDPDYDVMLRLAYPGPKARARARLKIAKASCVAAHRVMQTGGRAIVQWGAPIYIEEKYRER